MKSEQRQWLWPVLLASLIFVASSRQMPEVPTPGWLQFDKLAHFSVYGLMATLLARIPRVRGWPVLGVWWAVVMTSLYGVSDEVHQYFVPERSSDLADWVADTVGALVAVVAYAKWTAYRHLLEWRRPAKPAKLCVENTAEAVSNDAQ